MPINATKTSDGRGWGSYNGLSASGGEGNCTVPLQILSISALSSSSHWLLPFLPLYLHV